MEEEVFVKFFIYNILFCIFFFVDMMLLVRNRVNVVLCFEMIILNDIIILSF